MSKISVGESFIVALISGTEKVWRRGRGCIKIFSRIFLSHGAENLRRESFTVALISSTGKVWRRGRVGVSRFSVKNFLSHSAENLRWESFTVALFPGTEKVWIEGGGSIKIIRPIFLSHSVEKFRRGILYCCINFRWRKSLWTRGGKGVSRFSIKDFLSHSAENLRREFFTVALFSGTEKVWIEWGEYQDNPSIFFVSQCRKLP